MTDFERMIEMMQQGFKAIENQSGLPASEIEKYRAILMSWEGTTPTPEPVPRKPVGDYRHTYNTFR